MMPLVKSKSKGAFSKNISAEIHAGKPPKQAAAIAYAVQRRAKKAEGGNVKTGLYANIHAKQERIKQGSGEKMRKPGAPGAPTAKAFKQSAKTAKMSDGGLPDYPYRVPGRDPLASRIGANQAFKVPRKGQTDMRNIPVGNDPSSRMSDDDYVQRTNAKERAQRPDFVKRSIKANLGKHPAPKLPKATGGKVKKSCW